MGIIHMVAWILLYVPYVSAKSSQKEKATFEYDHCKTSHSDRVCGEHIKDCCPEGFILIDKTCYYFSSREQKKSLIEADKYCKELNASIFIPNSFEEMKTISTRLSAMPHIYGFDWIWIGLRKENQDKPKIDFNGNMDLSTLNWSKAPYVQEYANLSLFMCDAVWTYYGHNETFAMYPCGRPNRFICERRPTPRTGVTDNTNPSTSTTFLDDVSSDPKLVRTARLFEVDVTPDPKMCQEEFMRYWTPDEPVEDDDGIISEAEMRRYQSESDTKRIFYEELLLNAANEGKEETQAGYIAWLYEKQEAPLSKNRKTYKKKLEMLREVTRNMPVDIKTAEMDLKRNISYYEVLLETLENCRKTFCSTLARVKKERYQKTLTKEEI